MKGVRIDHLPVLLYQGNEAFAGLEALGDLVHRKQVVKIASKFRCFNQGNIFRFAERAITLLVAKLCDLLLEPLIVETIRATHSWREIVSGALPARWTTTE